MRLPWVSVLCAAELNLVVAGTGLLSLDNFKSIGKPLKITKNILRKEMIGK